MTTMQTCGTREARFRGWPPVCDHCGRPTTPGQAVLSVSHDAIDECWEERRRRDEDRDPDAYVDLALVDRLPLAPWRYGCWPCGPWRRYAIAADRLQMPGDWLAWGAHLSAKVWLPFTNWAGAIRRFWSLPPLVGRSLATEGTTADETPEDQLRTRRNHGTRLALLEAEAMRVLDLCDWSRMLVMDCLRAGRMPLDPCEACGRVPDQRAVELLSEAFNYPLPPGMGTA